MIECVKYDTQSNFSGSPLTQMHRLRFKVCILKWEWTKILVAPTMSLANDNLDKPHEQLGEFDDYDIHTTEYLVERSTSGKVKGCIRIGSTMAPYMLRDHFKSAVGEEYTLPCSEQDNELSRLVVDPALDREEKRKCAIRLFAAAQERAMQKGVNAYWGIILEQVIPVFTNAGYEVEKTGSPVIYPNTGEKIYGVRLPVNEQILARCKQMAGIEDIDSLISFGFNNNSSVYGDKNVHQPLLDKSTAILSDDFYRLPAFEKITGRQSIHLEKPMEITYGK